VKILCSMTSVDRVSRLVNIQLLFIILMLASCQRQEVVSISGKTMGTTYSIKYWQSESTLDTKVAKAEVDKLLLSINQEMSTYIPTSTLSKVNAKRSTDWITIPERLYHLLSEAQKIATMTDGAFDVTVGPLVNLWGFGPDGQRQVPNKVEIQVAKKRVGHEKLSLQYDSIKREYQLKKEHPRLYIDLSAMAKGYGVDMVSELLGRLGAINHMVEIGGEVRTAGSKAGKPWSVAIESPSLEGTGRYSKVLKLSDQAVATSGSYRNFFMVGEKSYSHTINPKTGKPVAHALISASVIDKRCALADAYATALMVMGFKRAREFARLAGVRAYLIYQNQGKRVAGFAGEL
jgi:FAD:protein FMN transferase